MNDKKDFNPDDPFADIAKFEDASQWNKTGNTTPVDVHTDLNQATIARFEEPCFKCRGSGSWRLGYTCFCCKGKGKLYYKTSPEVRAEQKRRRNEKKKADALANFERGADWLLANPGIHEYLKEEAAKDNKWSQFPREMLEAIYKFGSLTPGQLAAVEKGVARKTDWAKANKKEATTRDARTANAKLDLSGLLNAFAAAVTSGLKAPKLHIGNLRITRAKDNSRNPGFLYVNLNTDYEDRTYFGKISPDGKFFAGRDCTDEIFEDIKKLSGDVLKAAQAHGALTGNCSMCNRLLTNELSVQLGIGPICRGKWGL